uniref:Uncharacterized protein n=1 Tax=Setaria italica TaxID=4555 RepID=K3YFB5_SETIT
MDSGNLGVTTRRPSSPDVFQDHVLEKFFSLDPISRVDATSKGCPADRLDL